MNGYNHEHDYRSVDQSLQILATCLSLDCHADGAAIVKTGGGTRHIL
jgi:hypothetical protein